MPKPSPAVAPNLLKRPEAAQALGISERQVRRLTASGELDAVRIGRRVLYSPEALGRFVARQGNASSRGRSRPV